MVDKAGLLDAIAQAGTRGADAYRQAQAQLQASQDAAVRQALLGAGSATPEYQAQLAQTISSPYQQRIAALQSNSAGASDYFNRLGTASGTYMDQVAALIPAIERRNELALAARASGGGGGGGGGSSKETDWYSNLKDVFGTAELAKSGILGEVQNDWHQTGLPNYQAARQYAAQQYGVPPGIASNWYGQTRDEAAYEALVNKQASKVRNQQQLRQFTQHIRRYGLANPTVVNSGYYNNQAINKARQQVQQRRRKGR